MDSKKDSTDESMCREGMETQKQSRTDCGYTGEGEGGTHLKSTAAYIYTTKDKQLMGSCLHGTGSSTWAL